MIGGQALDTGIALPGMEAGPAEARFLGTHLSSAVTASFDQASITPCDMSGRMIKAVEYANASKPPLWTRTQYLQCHLADCPQLELTDCECGRCWQ